MGYWEVFRKEGRIDVHFLPAITISLQFVILLFAGLLNILTEVVVFIWIAGIILFLISLYNEGLQFIRKYFTVGYMCSAFLLILLAIAVHGKLFAAYDDFSHWALIVKNLLETGQLPTGKDTLITFQSYPLGSSLWIFYFCSLLNSSEPLQMLAQAYMAVSMMLPWFSFIKGNRFLCALFILLMENFILCYNIKIYTLQVDTLLPLASMCTTLFLIHEYKFHPQTGRNFHVLAALTLLTWIPQIKDSGIFFVAVAGILLAVKLRQSGAFNTRQLLLPVISPILGIIVWKIHCRLVFTNSESSRHAATLSNFFATSMEKSWKDIAKIIINVFDYIIIRKEFVSLISCLLILGLIAYKLGLFHRLRCKRFFVFSTAMYLTYALGLIAMYTFSMPLAEAQRLAGMSRYIKTIDIALYYFLSIYCISFISSVSESTWKRLCVSIVCILLIIGAEITRFGIVATFFHYYDGDKRHSFQNIITSYAVPQGKSYFICLSEDDRGYYKYLGKYLLNSKDVTVEIISSATQLEQLRKYNYLIIPYSGNPFVNTWLQQNGYNTDIQAVVTSDESV